MKTIFVLMDTVNRRMLDLYNENPAETALTPNLRRLAARVWCSIITGPVPHPACPRAATC